MAYGENRTGSDWRKVPLLAILLFQGAALIARSYVQVILRERGSELNYAADLSFLVVPPILLVLMYPVLLKHGHLLLALFPRDRLSVRVIVIGVLLGLTLRLAFWGALVGKTAFGIQISGEPMTAFGPDLMWQCPPWWLFGFGILVSAVLIPPIEEVIYRGFFLHGLLGRGRFLAIAASSLLFAVFHNPQTIFIAFWVGVFLAFAALNSGALWLSVIAHVSYNLMVQFDWRCLRGNWSAPDLTAALAGVGALGFALMLVSLLLAAMLVSRRIIGPQSAAR
jgi:membrane protease YdiL (CAAX protease family)